MQLRIALGGLPAAPKRVIVAFESFLRDGAGYALMRMGVSAATLSCTFAYTDRRAAGAPHAFVVRGEFHFVSTFFVGTSLATFREKLIPLFDRALAEHFPHAMGVCLVSCDRLCAPHK